MFSSVVLGLKKFRTRSFLYKQPGCLRLMAEVELDIKQPAPGPLLESKDMRAFFQKTSKKNV